LFDIKKNGIQFLAAHTPREIITRVDLHGASIVNSRIRAMRIYILKNARSGAHQGASALETPSSEYGKISDANI
jgi:hypothetical protein